MTKTLTEQYMEGIIKEGEFWVVKKGCEPSTIYLFDSPTARRCIKAKRLKLLAPVPSYDEYQRLVSNSDESIDPYITNPGDCQQIVEDNLNRQIERLQEQLKEAQHTIYCIANTDGSDCKTILETIIRDANLYLEKWGVK